jgi:hypothetical protein
MDVAIKYALRTDDAVLIRSLHNARVLDAAQYSLVANALWYNAVNVVRCLVDLDPLYPSNVCHRAMQERARERERERCMDSDLVV